MASTAVLLVLFPFLARMHLLFPNCDGFQGCGGPWLPRQLTVITTRVSGRAIRLGPASIQLAGQLPAGQPEAARRDAHHEFGTPTRPHWPERPEFGRTAADCGWDALRWLPVTGWPADQDTARSGDE